ncbi:MAG: cupin domain-containing protein [Clostridia bacterium]|nr:cupin domain-containing protein [Clostridia bacterium]
MIIDYGKIEEKAISDFKGGEKIFNVKMFTDENNKIMMGRLEPGASIGLHTHSGNSEIILIQEGKGKVLYNGEYLPLRAGDVHYCPMGQEHSLINDSSEDLKFFAVVGGHR